MKHKKSTLGDIVKISSSNESYNTVLCYDANWNHRFFPNETIALCVDIDDMLVYFDSCVYRLESKTLISEIK